MSPHKKQQLPTKTCARCGLLFPWRKKWARDGDEVRYGSQRYRRSDNLPPVEP